MCEAPGAVPRSEARRLRLDQQLARGASQRRWNLSHGGWPLDCGHGAEDARFSRGNSMLDVHRAGGHPTRSPTGPGSASPQPPASSPGRATDRCSLRRRVRAAARACARSPLGRESDDELPTLQPSGAVPRPPASSGTRRVYGAPTRSRRAFCRPNRSPPPRASATTRRTRSVPDRKPEARAPIDSPQATSIRPSMAPTVTRSPTVAFVRQGRRGSSRSRG